MQTDTTSSRLQINANRIAVGAAFISLIGAFISALPLMLNYSQQRHHIDGLISGLVSEGRSAIKTARTHTMAGSPADDFVILIDRWWYAAAWAERDTDSESPSGGESEPQGNGYKVCLPRLLPGDPVCFIVDAFVNDPNTGLVNRFSIDGIPVDSLASLDTDSKDLLPKGMPLDIRLTGDLVLPSQHLRCDVYRVAMESGDQKSMMYFNRKAFETQDVNSKGVASRFLWPGYLHRFESGTAVVCIPDYGGWLWLVRQKSAKDTTTADANWLWVS